MFITASWPTGLDSPAAPHRPVKACGSFHHRTRKLFSDKLISLPPRVPRWLNIGNKMEHWAGRSEDPDPDVDVDGGLRTKERCNMVRDRPKK